MALGKLCTKQQRGNSWWGSKVTSPPAALGSVHSSGLIQGRLLSTPTLCPRRPLGFLGPGTSMPQGGSSGAEKGSTGLGVRRPECDPSPDLQVPAWGGGGWGGWSAPHPPESSSMTRESCPTQPDSQWAEAKMQQRTACNSSCLEQIHPFLKQLCMHRPTRFRKT